jgi:F-box interacting protein
MAMGSPLHPSRKRRSPLHRDLPDEVVIWEILTRLDPKALLRCRAVCRAWRQATSTREFLVVHHGHQPTLPLLRGYGKDFLDIIPFDHRTRLVAADQLQPIARLQLDYDIVKQQSCDGLLLLHDHDYNTVAICNPATRQYAPLRQIDGFRVFGMYPHRPTGEYRLLLYPYPARLEDAELHDGCHVFTLGSCQSPRHIGWPEAKELMLEIGINVLFRGSLHWCMGPESSKRGTIMVFDTTAESFRQMQAPPVPPDYDDLFEMDGMLTLASFNDAAAAIGIWVLQDYESEVWTFKCQIQLPAQDIWDKFGKINDVWNVIVTSSDEDVIVLVWYDQRLLHIDINGKLVTAFHGEVPCRDSLRLKKTLVLHSFFPALEGYVVNDFPFMSTCEGCLVSRFFLTS